MKDSFKDLSYKELLSKREELKKKYRDFRFKTIIGHIDNPLQKRTLKRKIARLNTIIYEYDMDIRKESKTQNG